jgi:hypothetical protein
VTIMFQYKGKAYAFCALDEVLIDIEKAIAGIEAGDCPAMPMTPEEVTAFLVERKKNPGNFPGLNEDTPN